MPGLISPQNPWHFLADAHNVSGASTGEIQPKKVAGIGFGNIFAGNQKIELRNVKPGVSGGSTATAPSPASDVMKKSAEGPAVAASKDGLVPKVSHILKTLKGNEFLIF